MLDQDVPLHTFCPSDSTTNSLPRLPKVLYCVVHLANLAQPKVTWEEGLSIEELSQSDWPVDMSVRNHPDWLLIRRAQPTMWRHHSYVGGPGLCHKASKQE